MKTFTFYQDPSHGWLKVPESLVRELGIAEKISKCSYERNDSVYLEEDMDAQTFIEAYKVKFGGEPKFVSKHTNKSSKIRSYRSYTYYPQP